MTIKKLLKLYYIVVITVLITSSYAWVQKVILNNHKIPEISVLASTSISPAISVTLRPTLFDYVAHVAVEILNEKFHGLNLDDIDTIVNVKVIGDVHILFTNIRLVELTADPDLANILLGEGNLALDIENVYFQLEADFEYDQLRFPHLRGHGHLIITGQEGLLGAISVFQESEGSMRMLIVDAATDFSSINIKISGSNANWLYNALAGIFKEKFKATICDKITTYMKETLPEEANRIFAGMPRTLEIFGAQLNMSFADNPSIRPDAAVMYIYGLFQSPISGRFEECPYSTRMHNSMLSRFVFKSHKPKSTVDKMLKTTLHVSSFNCFAWALHKQGRLVFHLTRENFSEELLNTSLWANYIPGVKERFPVSKAMYLDLDLHLAPTGTINSEEGIVVSINNVTSKFSAIMDEDDTVGLELFTLSINVLLGAIAEVVPSSPDVDAFLRLRGELTTGDISVQVLNSNVGALNPDKIGTLFKVIFSRITDNMTEYLDNNPIDIPSIPLIALQNGVISFQNDVGLLDADLRIGLKEDFGVMKM